MAYTTVVIALERVGINHYRNSEFVPQGLIETQRLVWMQISFLKGKVKAAWSWGTYVYL